MTLNHRLVTAAALAIAAVATASSVHAQSVQTTGNASANITTDRRPVPLNPISHCLTFNEPTRAKCLAAEKQQKPKPRSRRSASASR